MRAAVLSEGSVSSRWTVAAMKKYFDHVDTLHLKDIEIVMDGRTLEVLHKGTALEKYDCIYAKGSFHYASLLRAFTYFLNEHTYFPIQPAAFSTGHDKLLTHLELQRHKVPMPKTYLASTPASMKMILESKVNYPVVMKFPSGTQGKGVMFADSYSSAASLLDALVSLKQPFIIQEYVETGGVDIRAIVVGDEVVVCMKRKAVEGEKRANIHVGGKGEAYTPSPEVRKLAVDTAHAIGVDICAVDIVEGAKGPLVLELNLSPGLQGITAATKIDVADKIARFLHEKATSFTLAKTKSGTEKIMSDLGIEQDQAKEIITSLDFRTNRILLPAIVTKITAFNEKSDVVIQAEKDRLVLKKFK